MDTTLRFRRSLLHSLLATTALTGLPACGDDAATGAGGSGGSGASGGSSSEGGSGAQGSGGDAQGGAGQGGAQGGAGQGGSLEGGAGGAANPMDVERCFTIGDEACPAIADAPTRFANCTENGEFVSNWDSGPVEKLGQCCYVVDLDLQNQACGAIGRPFVVEGKAVTSPIHATGALRDATRASIVEGLDVDGRAEIARLYALDAAYEHASVASFSKFSLELMRFGAPTSLLQGAHEAALDEVRHASLCLSLASTYAGAELAPAGLPISADLALAPDLESFVVALVREGCMGETIASVIAAAQAASATHAVVADALSLIARDESTHAELAWRTLAWVLTVGDGSLRRVASQAFEQAIAEALAIPSDGARFSSPEHGRLSSRDEATERRRAIEEIVRPAMSAALG